jgi:hypothetical protein
MPGAVPGIVILAASRDPSRGQASARRVRWRNPARFARPRRAIIAPRYRLVTAKFPHRADAAIAQR